MMMDESTKDVLDVAAASTALMSLAAWCIYSIDVTSSLATTYSVFADYCVVRS
jgi:hypothetical protein